MEYYHKQYHLLFILFSFQFPTLIKLMQTEQKNVLMLANKHFSMMVPTRLRIEESLKCVMKYVINFTTLGKDLSTICTASSRG